MCPSVCLCHTSCTIDSVSNISTPFRPSQLQCTLLYILIARYGIRRNFHTDVFFVFSVPLKEAKLQTLRICDAVAVVSEEGCTDFDSHFVATRRIGCQSRWSPGHIHWEVVGMERGQVCRHIAQSNSAVISTISALLKAEIPARTLYYIRIIQSPGYYVVSRQARVTRICFTILPG